MHQGDHILYVWSILERQRGCDHPSYSVLLCSFVTVLIDWFFVSICNASFYVEPNDEWTACAVSWINKPVVRRCLRSDAAPPPVQPLSVVLWRQNPTARCAPLWPPPPGGSITTSYVRREPVIVHLCHCFCKRNRQPDKKPTDWM